MKIIKELSIFITILFLISGCVVTKKSYTTILSELTALENEKQKIEKELGDQNAEKDKKIFEQKNRISSLEGELKDLQLKYDEDLSVAASRQSELNQSIETLKEESTEETQMLLQQIEGLQEKYDKEMDSKNQIIEKLKSDNRNKVEILKNKLDHEIQSNKLVVRDLKEQIETLDALTTEQEKALKELSKQADQIEKQLKEEIEKGEIKLKRYKTKTIINIDNSILFDSGKAFLKKSVEKSLTKISKALADFPGNNIQIEGHTDDVPIHTERFPSNWELSSARALAVLRFFIERKDLDPRKLSAVGLGEYHPLMPNDTHKNRHLNRRVDIVILPK